MKCVCGYEYKKGMDMTVVGDEPFKHMIVHGEMDRQWDGYVTKDICNRDLYICPKCGTVRFDE